VEYCHYGAGKRGRKLEADEKLWFNLRLDLTGDTTAELCLIELDTSR
jgi:hypothetical protein